MNTLMFYTAGDGTHGPEHVAIIEIQPHAKEHI